MKKGIKKYTQLNGISGNSKVIKKELKKTFTKNNGLDVEIFEDNIGGIASLIKKPGATKTICFMAHQDEVGLMVKNILKNGLVKIAPIGGITVESLISQRINYISENKSIYTGVILASSPHLKEKKVEKISDLEIDFGFKSLEDAKNHGLKVGTYLNFEGEFKELVNDNFVSKACDNRIGIALIEKIFEELKELNTNYNIVLGATVQEETGLRGVGPLFTKLNTKIDEVYVLDVSPIDNMEDFKLGKGPLLRIAEPRTVYSPKLNQNLCDMVRGIIDVQEYISKGRTDGAAILMQGSGHETTAICIPALNLHTNSTICNFNDIDSAYKIIKMIIENKNEN